MEIEGFVTDANVLIDYCNTDLLVLSLAARFLGPLYVPLQVLAQVDQLDHSECERAGLVLFEPSTEQLLEAGQGTTQLAFDDRICLIVCRDNRWTCLTNDKALRRICTAKGIRILWGLELMLQLVNKGLLSPENAWAIAKRIHSTNPAFIDRNVLEAFRKKIR